MDGDGSQFDCLNHGMMLKPDRNSSTWGDCVQIAVDLESRDNPIGNRLYFLPAAVIEGLYENGDSGMWFGNAYEGAFDDGIMIGNHVFFNY